MNKRFSLILLGLIFFLTLVLGACNFNQVFSGEQVKSMKPLELKTEYCTNPVGLDTVPRFSWSFENSGRGQYQKAYRILVASSEENLKNDRGDRWDSGKIPSPESVNVQYGGKLPGSGEKCYWKVKIWDKNDNIISSDMATFEMGLLKKEDWKGKFINVKDDHFTSPLLRKEFELEKEVKQARAYVYGLGWYEMYLNGAKVGNDVLTPANSQYEIYNLYNTYDVTSALKKGKNAVGFWLASGYGNSYSEWGWRWQKSKAALLQLDITFTDGSRTSIVTDDTWKASYSPITYENIYNGETYDAQYEQKGWNTPGFDDSSWEKTEVVNMPIGKLVSSTMPPIRVVDTLKPVKMTEVKPGVYVFDLGQNIAGWARLKVKGTKGTKVELNYSELVDAQGRIDPWTNRNAKASDTYILGGKGEETYEPRFTYHGFRYVEVIGYPGKPTLDSIEGCVVHSDLAHVGSFSTSNELMNQIQSNFQWGMLNNFMSIPTDCPQRDERTPCLMDSMVVEEAAIQNFDMAQYYTKWMQDIAGSPRNPDWGGDQVNLAWNLYQYYNDKRIIEKNYDTLKRYVDYMENMTLNHIYKDGFGDWCAPNNNTWESFFNDVREVNTALHYRHTYLLSKMADLLGKVDDKKYYGNLAEEIKQAFHAEFWKEDKQCYGDGSQTTSILPLAFGIVPADKKDIVVKQLVDNITNEKENHLDTGIFGTKYIADVLADNGYTDLAYTVLTQDTYPSFGYQIKDGATTTWEQWAAEGGMHSHDHAMFAGVGASFYTRFAGIKPLSPGYKKIGIKPYLPKGLDHVDSSIKTIRGLVKSSWKKNGDALVMEVTIPANTKAEISVPKRGNTGIVIKEGDKKVWEKGSYISGVQGILGAKDEKEYVTFQVESGSYRFEVK